MRSSTDDGATTLGIEVHDVSLATADPPVGEFASALAEHGLLVFRKQHLTAEQHIALAERFGRIDEFDTRVPNATATPHVPRPAGTRVVVEQRDEGTGERVLPDAWRADGSFKDPAVTLSIRAAVEVDGGAGVTEVADMRAAYDALADDTRAQVDDLRVWHSAVYVRAALGELSFAAPADPTELPGAWHPLVCRHPVTGRAALYLGQNACLVEGLPLDEGRALLSQLTTDACTPERVYAHEWQPGDVLVWDCRSVVHRTGPPHDGHQRLLRHISVIA